MECVRGAGILQLMRGRLELGPLLLLLLSTGHQVGEEGCVGEKGWWCW